MPLVHVGLLEASAISIAGFRSERAGAAPEHDGPTGRVPETRVGYRAESDPTLIFQSWMFPRSTLLLAEALQRQGHLDDARGLVERLLSGWRDAGPDLPDLARARALCARLRCHPASRARESARPDRSPAGHPE